VFRQTEDRIGPLRPEGFAAELAAPRRPRLHAGTFKYTASQRVHCSHRSAAAGFQSPSTGQCHGDGMSN